MQRGLLLPRATEWFAGIAAGAVYRISNAMQGTGLYGGGSIYWGQVFYMPVRYGYVWSKGAFLLYDQYGCRGCALR